MSHTIADRIKQVRGGMAVGGFADSLGVNRKTVTRWESGDSIPDGASLIALKRLYDVDPSWLLTGEGAGLELSSDERELLSLYRSASLPGKMAAVGALQGAASADSTRVGGNQVVVKGDGNRVAGGVYHRHGAKKK